MKNLFMIAGLFSAIFWALAHAWRDKEDKK